MDAIKLNYVEGGLSRLCGGYGGTPNVRFYDVTSWSYVNLDDPFSDYSQFPQQPIILKIIPALSAHAYLWVT